MLKDLKGLKALQYVFDIVSYHPSTGANKDQAKNHGATPAFIEAQSGYLKIVHDLVEAGPYKEAAPMSIADALDHLDIHVQTAKSERHRQLTFGRLKFPKHAEMPLCTVHILTRFGVGPKFTHSPKDGLMFQMLCHIRHQSVRESAPVDSTSKKDHGVPRTGFAG